MSSQIFVIIRGGNGKRGQDQLESSWERFSQHFEKDEEIKFHFSVELEIAVVRAPEIRYSDLESNFLKKARPKFHFTVYENGESYEESLFYFYLIVRDQIVRRNTSNLSTLAERLDRELGMGGARAMIELLHSRNALTIDPISSNICLRDYYVGTFTDDTNSQDGTFWRLEGDEDGKQSISSILDSSLECLDSIPQEVESESRCRAKRFENRLLSRVSALMDCMLYPEANALVARYCDSLAEKMQVTSELPDLFREVKERSKFIWGGQLLELTGTRENPAYPAVLRTCPKLIEDGLLYPAEGHGRYQLFGAITCQLS